ncbi:MAG TPA: acyltransferase [Flavobacteriales bacterium]|nr:acyltransferase [Flavobacteriales bacterium]
MDRKKVISGHTSETLFNELNHLHDLFSKAFKNQFDRSLPFSEEMFDRWERAKKLNFGEGTSVYDSAFIFGTVNVGKNCWIGPFTIVDGSGGLNIGDNCTISAGTHIYTHDNVKKTLSGGKLPMEHAPVTIGTCTYIGPQCMVVKGITIGKHCLVASNSFVSRNLPDFSIAAGNPAKIIGKVVMKENSIEFEYTT